MTTSKLLRFTCPQENADLTVPASECAIYVLGGGLAVSLTCPGCQTRIRLGCTETIADQLAGAGAVVMRPDLTAVECDVFADELAALSEGCDLVGLMQAEAVRR